MEHYLYLFLNLFSISYPIYKSFDKRVRYHTNWTKVLLALIPMAILMITWDAIFTKMGVWGFNPAYNVGLEIFGLPLEEVLFFICIPFASIFIYEVVIYFDKNDKLKKYGFGINLAMIAISLILIITGYNQLYTIVTAVLLFVLALIHQFVLKSYKTYLGRFYVSFVFILLPFFLVNGILTGAFITDEVVWYNMNETYGFRIGTIPFEDFFYCLFMMLFTVTFYEWFKKKSSVEVN